ncbi:hypothetical protein OY671_011954, partial [Metschnikowia pulcherrima]
DEATPSRLVYRTPVLPPDWHIVCDIHSHGTGPAFFSTTDDADDAHATKISLVFGRLDQPDGPTRASPHSPEIIMKPETSNRHYLPAAFDDRALKVSLIGCGGNGAQMSMGLASLDTASRAISSRSSHVTVVDDDIVTEANLGR